MTNSIMVIAPYRYRGAWVFDDQAKGLEKEPFIAGIPGMIEDITRGIPNAWKGFRLLFSASPFPGYQAELEWDREESGGAWYRHAGTSAEGWLCPSLFKYFDSAPIRIYVKAESL
jgi:hypothetical protein